MDLSIVIPSYNTKKLLMRCLDSIAWGLADAVISYEIIVVDNASKDGTVEILNNKYPHIIKVFNNKNLGYGKANNIGIRKARGNVILLLNSDIEVQDKAIQELYSFAVARNRSFVGGKLFNEDGTVQPSCGPQFTLPVVFLMLFAKGDTLEVTRYSPDTVRRVDWVSGACLMGSKRAFLDVGLFDENIFMYMEEIEFLYRAKHKGYTVWFCPDAHFIHSGAASSRKRRTPVVNIYRGLTYFYQKHHHSVIALGCLRYMLKAKALAAMLVGCIMRKHTLYATYEEAIRLV